MTDELVRKNVCIHGHRTSLRLESEIWEAIADICRLEGVTIHEFCSFIEHSRTGDNRTSALRKFIVQYFREAATREGHELAGHGRLSDESGVLTRRSTPSLPAYFPVSR